LKTLETLGFTAQVNEIRAFLERYGDRAFEELKLECMTFKQDPRAFLKLAAWMARRPRGATAARPARAEKKPVPIMAFPARDRWLLKWLTPFTESAIQAREATRLLRGRYFGWVRRGILVTARQLRSEHPGGFAGHTDLAFFGLRLRDLEAYGNGELDAAGLAARLSAGARWDAIRRDYPECFCHPDHSPGLVPYFAEPAGGDETPVDAGARELSGTGASMGKVRGRALVLQDPRDAMNYPDLSGYVLVTRSTDPAWIFIMSQCAGLVSEKGSLLSHTAIIGRELGIPTVVGVPKAVSLLKTGEPVEVDGEQGRILRLWAGD
jgi:pyruvate,water dikinase